MTRIPVRGFDFHCHADLFSDPAAMIAACERDRIVTLAVTTTPRAWTQNCRWTAESPYVHSAIGLHPELVAERHAEISLLEDLMRDTRLVGEVGLDGTPPHRRSLALQAEVFDRALAAAQRLGGRIVSIHSRRAGRDVLAFIRERTTRDRVLPILHWFSDSPALARQGIDNDCYFSVNPRMLDHDSGRALVRGLPASRILTESDAPFTSQDPKCNKPGDVLGLCQRLADLRAVSVQEMRETLADNAERVCAFAGIDVTFDLLE